MRRAIAFEIRGVAARGMRIGQTAEELWRKSGSAPEAPRLSYSPLSIPRSKTLT
jgi:hypothetical protein